LSRGHMLADVSAILGSRSERRQAGGPARHHLSLWAMSGFQKDAGI
jgi:hypothetical protein